MFNPFCHKSRQARFRSTSVLSRHFMHNTSVCVLLQLMRYEEIVLYGASLQPKDVTMICVRGNNLLYKYAQTPK